MLFNEQEIAEISQSFETETPEAMIAWAVRTFGRGVTLGSSLGPQDVVLMHMLSQIDPSADIFFLDTGLHFKETYQLQTVLEAQLGVRLTSISPAQNVHEQALAFGPALWARDADACCGLRKVEPMRQHLQGFTLWITGMRRDQSATRTTIPILSVAPRFGLLKLNPLAAWDEARTWAYLEQHALPTNALHRQNYPSIGCWPCTQPVAPGADPRSGRWAGMGKTECGLHVATSQATAA